MSEAADRTGGIEWITLGLIALCYALWGASLFWLAASFWPAAPVLAVLAAGLLAGFHSSLSHEVLHGHPFASKALSEALVALPLTLFIPFNRFRDLHLAHHHDPILTDPYDDPESNFLDPRVWQTLPRWKQVLYGANNTLVGRILLGPAIGQARFLADEWRAARRGDRAVWLAWALHLPAVGVVVWIVAASAMPVWAYLISAYMGLGLVKIRTFLEHRAHDKARGRTVIIEDRGPLALLFLNNNLHAVHHMNPSVAWYALPALYRAGRERFLACNEGYLYRSYGEVFRRHFWRAKDPVAHPLWRRP